MKYRIKAYCEGKLILNRVVEITDFSEAGIVAHALLAKKKMKQDMLIISKVFPKGKAA